MLLVNWQLVIRVLFIVVLAHLLCFGRVMTEESFIFPRADVTLLVLQAFAGFFLFLAPIIDEIIFIFVLGCPTLDFIGGLLLMAACVLIIGVTLFVMSPCSLLGGLRLCDFGVLALF